MLTNFAAKLATRFSLSAEDQLAVISLPGTLRRYSPGQVISSEDKPAKYVGAVVSGFASSFKIVHGKDQQITGFLLPGDGISIPSILIGKPSAHVIANVVTDIYWIKHQDLLDICLSRASVASALWLDTLIDAGIAQEWMANIGRRHAQDRIAHLFLEVAARQERIGELDDDTFELPIKQPELASAVALSLVHTNKSLRALDATGYISRNGQHITLNDRGALAKKVGFDPTYLWLGSPRFEPASGYLLPHNSHDPDPSPPPL